MKLWLDIANAANRSQTIRHLPKQPVGDDDVRSRIQRQLNSTASVSSNLDLVTRVGKDSTQGARLSLVVLHDENLRHGAYSFLQTCASRDVVSS